MSDFISDVYVCAASPEQRAGKPGAAAATSLRGVLSERMPISKPHDRSLWVVAILAGARDVKNILVSGLAEIPGSSLVATTPRHIPGQPRLGSSTLIEEFAGVPIREGTYRFGVRVTLDSVRLPDAFFTFVAFADPALEK